MDAGQLYAEARGRITELVRGLGPDDCERVVAATPAWTVKDLVAHLAGVLGDVRAGNVGGAATDPWTEQQVEARRGRTVDELLAEWGEHAAELEGQLGQFGGAVRMLIGDVVIHEQDLREALDQPGGRDSASYDSVLQGLVHGLGRRLEAEGLAALRIRAGSEEWIVGPGEPGATVSVDRHELFRGLSGRRSLLAMGSWDWEGDAAPYLPHLALFTPPDEQPSRLGDPDNQPAA